MDVILAYAYTFTGDVRYDTTPTPLPTSLVLPTILPAHTLGHPHTPLHLTRTRAAVYPLFPTTSKLTGLIHFHRGYMSKGDLSPYGQAIPSCRHSLPPPPPPCKVNG